MRYGVPYKGSKNSIAEMTKKIIAEIKEMAAGDSRDRLRRRMIYAALSR